MTERIKIKPAAGLKVRMPPVPGGDAYLPEAGTTVEMSTYWLRHLNDKSIELVKEDQPAAPAAEETPAATVKKGK